MLGDNLIICTKCRKQHFKGEEVCVLCNTKMREKPEYDLLEDVALTTHSDHLFSLLMIRNLWRFFITLFLKAFRREK